jgi:hypothetical protein
MVTLRGAKKTKNKKFTNNDCGEFDLLWRIPTCGHLGTELPSPRAFCTEVPAIGERPNAWLFLHCFMSFLFCVF